ncbi:MAG: hypothetical protein CVU03_06200 [Bacteroidetes bacterium HGW-Bacteroidetes-2]|jgi:hypothetical protein|nr:MAG: hypothetical protein CVU03_06200 [Bacteroidetes bacterium HGW-Bacteroidetes-2]
MEFVSLELGIALLLLFVVPVIYAVTNQSRKEKKTIKKVENLCKTKAVKLTSSDIFQSLFIGIDENAKYLVTATVPVKEETIELYHLKDIKSCNLYKREVPKAGQPKIKIIEGVSLELILHDKTKHEIIFFDDDHGMNQDLSVNQASTWNEIIRKNLV